MSVRILKAVLVLFVGLMALMYAIQNIVNLDVAYQVVGAVLSMDGHEYYPEHFGPAITAGWMVMLGTWVIILTEIAAGLLALKGTWDLWSRRNEGAAAFNAAKGAALWGTGLGVVVWLGYFSAFGGAYFQMWQTELGGQSLGDAMPMALLCAVVLIFVNMPDD